MHALVRNWWVLLVRGIVALLFGIVVAMRPAAGIAAIVIVFGVYAFIFGAFAVGAAVLYSPRRRWDILIEGIVAIVAGVATFAQPGITAVALYSVVAAFAVVTGIMEIIAAVRLRGERVEGTGWLMGSGVVSILFGLLLIGRPQAGMLAIVYLMAAYGIVLGITLIAMSLRLRRFVHRVTPPRVPLTPQPV